MRLPVVLTALSGRLVNLRPFTVEDISDEYIGWLNDLRVTRFSNQRFRKHDRASSAAYLRSFADSDNLFVRIGRLDNDKHIGTMTAYINRNHQTVDVGLLVGDPGTWGKGYGQDAWDTLCNWLIDEIGIRKLTAGAALGNKAMVRIMERSGMQHEATRKGQEIIDGQPHDLVYFAKFNDA